MPRRSTSLLFALLPCLLVLINCQPMPVWTDNCVSVNSNSGTCMECIQGFYLEYFLCLPCAPLCQCSSQYNYCQSCMTLPFEDTNYTLMPILSLEFGRCFLCEQFIDSCMACNSTNYCTQCYGGYFPVGQPDGSSGPSSACTGQCPDNCEICSNATICQLCIPGYFLDPNTKNCSIQCGQNCTECLNSTTCKECFPGFFLNTTSNTCKNCNISDCLQCTNQSYCINCAPGYYAGNGSCVSTGFSNCVLYIGGAEQASGCQVCEAGYFVLYSSCFQCVGCELCSLQFLCQSKCFANATPFNYACLVPQALLEGDMVGWIGVGLLGFLMVMLQ